MPPLNFVWFSTTDWDAPQFGSRQQIARQLAGRYHRLLFVEVPRAPHSFLSDPAGTRRAVRRLGQLRLVATNVQAYTPWPVLPNYYHPSTNAINQRLLHLDLRRLVRRLGWSVDVFWTYWPNSAYLVGRLGERVAVYHCLDDFTTIRYPFVATGAIARMERELCQRVDLVITRTEALGQARRPHNLQTHILPGGVDAAFFDPARVSAAAADVAALPQPRAGFVGTIDDRVDMPMLAACARALPDIAFVLVGPVKRHLVKLNLLYGLTNIYWLPARPHTDVPAVIAGFDVGLIPYRQTPYAQALSPIKLYEYMAMGKPVVATDLPYLRREAVHVHLARTTDEFVAAIRAVLTRPATRDEQAQWRAVAWENSWDRQAEAIEGWLAGVGQR